MPRPSREKIELIWYHFLFLCSHIYAKPHKIHPPTNNSYQGLLSRLSSHKISSQMSVSLRRSSMLMSLLLVCVVDHGALKSSKFIV